MLCIVTLLGRKRGHWLTKPAKNEDPAWQQERPLEIPQNLRACIGKRSSNAHSSSFRLLQITLLAVCPSNGGVRDFLRREKQILARRRQQLHDSNPEEPEEVQIARSQRRYKLETPDNPLTLTRPQPRFSINKNQVGPVLNRSSSSVNR